MVDVDRLDTVIIPEEWFGVVPVEWGFMFSDGQKSWPSLGSLTGQEWAFLLSAYGQFPMAANTKLLTIPFDEVFNATHVAVERGNKVIAIV